MLLRVKEIAEGTINAIKSQPVKSLLAFSVIPFAIPIGWPELLILPIYWVASKVVSVVKELNGAERDKFHEAACKQAKEYVAKLKVLFDKEDLETIIKNSKDHNELVQNLQKIKEKYNNIRKISKALM